MAHMISVSDDKFVVSRDDGRGQPVGTTAESIVVEDIIVLTCADADHAATVAQVRNGTDRRHHLGRSPSGATQMVMPSAYDPSVMARMQRARFTGWRQA
jgi:hypothetical protein